MVHEELNEVKRIARLAGAILLRHYARPTSVEWKAPGDPVTAADREASVFIVDGLRSLFPEDGILSEELPDTPHRLGRSRVWLIDPMDGTREFISRRDDFAVMIGLAIDGTPAAGVVYQPTTDKLYYAAAGLGAFLDTAGETVRLSVSRERVASRMTLARSRSHRSSRVDAIARQLGIAEGIAMGSVGLKTGLICEGRAHLYVQAGNQTMIWDTCGPEAILREAGGRVSDASGRPLLYSGLELRNLRGVIASNGEIHERAVEVTSDLLARW